MCERDLKRFFANPGDGIRFELVEGKSRAKLLISPLDNTSPLFSSCHSESVNLPGVGPRLSLLMYSTAVLFSRLPKSLTVGGLSSSAACLPVTFPAVKQI